MPPSSFSHGRASVDFSRLGHHRHHLHPGATHKNRGSGATSTIAGGSVAPGDANSTPKPPSDSVRSTPSALASSTNPLLGPQHRNHHSVLPPYFSGTALRRRASIGELTDCQKHPGLARASFAIPKSGPVKSSNSPRGGSVDMDTADMSRNSTSAQQHETLFLSASGTTMEENSEDVLTVPARGARIAENTPAETQQIDALKLSMTGLVDFSSVTSRQLDETYYSVLERLSALQASLSAMRALAARTKALEGEFRHDAEQVTATAAVELDNLVDLAAQNKKLHDLDELAQRIERHREQMRVLSQRVDRVQDNISSWEAADKEWHDLAWKRIHMLWLSVVFVVMALVWALASDGGSELRAINMVQTVASAVVGHGSWALVCVGEALKGFLRHGARKVIAGAKNPPSVIDFKIERDSEVQIQSLKLLEEL